VDENEIAASVRANGTRNEALLVRFTEHGVSADDLLDAEVHFWAPSQRSAALLARELYSRGYLVLVLKPAAKGDGLWNLEAGRKTRLLDMISATVTEDLVRTAAKFEATYDGWGASIPAKKSIQ
jgi:regulator of RNase E activity RraB